MTVRAAPWLLATAFAAPPLSAQCLAGADPAGVECREPAPRWTGELATASANAAIGGLTAGLVAAVRGRDFADAFTRGALGGLASYVGKRLAAERFSGAGLLGREIGAVGASMTRNAAEGRGLLDLIVLPIGPVRLALDRGSGERISLGAKLDLTAAGWIVYGVAEPGLELDWADSFSAGTAVFRTRGTIMKLRGGGLAAGLTNAGVVYAADVAAFGRSFAARSVAHERVHVIQEDQLFTIWTDPLEDWAVDRLGVGAANRYVDLNLSTELLELLGRAIADHGARPWELEAIFLARE